MNRIALLADSGLPHASGIGRYQAKLLAHLHAAGPGIEFTAVTSSPLPPFEGMSSYMISFRSPGTKSIGWASRVAPLMKREGFDIVHLLFHAPFRTAGELPLVVSVQDINPLIKGRRHPQWRQRLYRRFMPDLLRGADRIIVPSAATAAEIFSCIDEPALVNRTRVIPLGADSVDYDSGNTGLGQDSAPTESTVNGASPGDIEPGTPFLLSVNPLAPWKEPERLIGLMRAVAAANLDHELVVTHSGDARRAARFRLRTSMAGLSRRIRILIDPDDGTLADLYKRAEVLVALASNEGFCLPAAEAMHHGCPVAYFRSGALPEVVGDAGFAADPEDYARLADSIVRLGNNPAVRNERSRLSQERVSLLSWKETARKTVDCYTELLQ